MAGQGFQRRRVLQILGSAAAAAHFPGFSKWGFACGHMGNAGLQIRPAAYRPQFCTATEFATLERLTEIIIPSDATPGAKEAGVAEFIDFMLAHDPENQYSFRTGFAWLDAYAGESAGKPFMQLTPEQQIALLEPLAYRDKAKGGKEAGHRFFAQVREFSVLGFYTSQIGFKELDNPALKFYSESPECPHQDDREHKHLAQQS